MSEDISPEVRAQVDALRKRIAEATSPFERILIYNETGIPFAVRCIAACESARPSERVAQAVHEHPVLTAQEIAAVLVDQDCARGDYAGCSPDLELAYIEYEALAASMIATRLVEHPRQEGENA